MTGPPSNLVGCTACVTRSLCVFSPLAPDVLDGVVHHIRLNPKDAIFRQGAPALGWHILCRGRAKLVLHTAQGERLLLRFGKPGDLLNLTVSGPHAFSAEAIDHCRVGFVDRDQLSFLLWEHPELLKGVLRRLSLWEERLARRVEDLAALGVQERLVRVLLELGEEHGIQEDGGLRIDLPLSHQDLADLVGASRQRVNLHLREFVNQGLIRADRGRLIILDEEGLQRLG